MKERVDKILVEQGLAESRQRAQALIMAGLVYTPDLRIEKPGQRVDPDIRLRLKERLPFVSRGGIKLEAALHHFQVQVQGRVALDLGASTGGFTDCLLKHGARRVYAVDVDPRQLDWGLRRDPRVFPIKRNARYLTRADLPEPPGIVTMDLSFISILKVLPALRDMALEAPLIALVKPQFEIGKGQVGKKGVVRDPARHIEVLKRLIAEAEGLGFGVLGVMPSPILGQKGNREFFIHWQAGSSPWSPGRVEADIEEALRNEKS